MDEQLADLWANFPKYLGGHILLSVTSLAAGLAISLPLGIAASRRPRLAESTLAVAGVIQTVPSLALLGIAVFTLGGLIGFMPAFWTLVLYSILPILANTVVGIRGVDAALTEAARGLGMSDRQMLWRVQLPLASPVILSGVRTSAVLVVGTATLATSVGGTSLGNYIYAGLSMMNHVATVFGCVAAALLAVVLDQFIHLLEVAARRRSRPLGWAAAAGLLLVAAGGLFDPVSRWLAGGSNAVIAYGTFTEQYILGHALANRLEAAGYRADRREGMAVGILFESLRRNQIDCTVEYTGDVWTRLMRRKEYADRKTTLKEVTHWLREEFGGVVCLGSLGFEDAYALAMPRACAEAWGVKSIADLAEHARKRLGRPLRVGGDIAFFELPEWRLVKERYGLDKLRVDFKAMEQTLMYDAVVSGELDVIAAYTSDGRVKAFELTILDDPEQTFPPYDAILLVSSAAAERPGFVQSLQGLLGAIDVETMQEANRRVDMDNQLPSKVSAWLLDTIEKRRR